MEANTYHRFLSENEELSVSIHSISDTFQYPQYLDSSSSQHVHNELPHSFLHGQRRRTVVQVDDVIAALSPSSKTAWQSAVRHSKFLSRLAAVVEATNTVEHDLKHIVNVTAPEEHSKLLSYFQHLEKTANILHSAAGRLHRASKQFTTTLQGEALREEELNIELLAAFKKQALNLCECVALNWDRVLKGLPNFLVLQAGGEVATANALFQSLIDFLSEQFVFDSSLKSVSDDAGCLKKDIQQLNSLESLISHSNSNPFFADKSGFAFVSLLCHHIAAMRELYNMEKSFKKSSCIIISVKEQIDAMHATFHATVLRLCHSWFDSLSNSDINDNGRWNLHSDIVLKMVLGWQLLYTVVFRKDTNYTISTKSPKFTSLHHIILPADHNVWLLNVDKSLGQQKVALLLSQAASTVSLAFEYIKQTHERLLKRKTTSSSSKEISNRDFVSLTMSWNLLQDVLNPLISSSGVLSITYYMQHKTIAVNQTDWLADAMKGHVSADVFDLFVECGRSMTSAVKEEFCRSIVWTKDARDSSEALIKVLQIFLLLSLNDKIDQNNIVDWMKLVLSSGADTSFYASSLKKFLSFILAPHTPPFDLSRAPVLRYVTPHVLPNNILYSICTSDSLRQRSSGVSASRQKEMDRL